MSKIAASMFNSGPACIGYDSRQSILPCSYSSHLGLPSQLQLPHESPLYVRKGSWEAVQWMLVRLMSKTSELNQILVIQLLHKVKWKCSNFDVGLVIKCNSYDQK